MATKAWREKNQDKLREYRRRWYYKNKERQIARQLEERRARMRRLREYKRTLRCTDCNMPFDEHPECCNFHHVDADTKEMEIIRCVYQSEKALQEELRKCIPVCANCHRIRTEAERND